MDKFGWSLWTELMFNNKDWNSSMDLPFNEDGEFVPNYSGWKSVFEKLDYAVEKSGLKGKIGACFHTSAEIPNIMKNLCLVEDFRKAHNEYRKSRDFEFGLHSTFGRNDLISMGNFEKILENDLNMCSILDGTCIVEHSPVRLKTEEKSIKMMVDELTSNNIIEILLKYPKISLSWENGSNPKLLVSSLGCLVRFLNALKDKYDEMGYSHLSNQHNLCLDTGHLLMAINKKRSLKKEIETTLPEFAKYLKVFHIHANNGKSDNHIILDSLEFFDHPSRKRIKPKKFLKNSEIVWDWLKICHDHRGMENRHIHLEALRMPFSLQQIIDFGKNYNEKILQ